MPRAWSLRAAPLQKFALSVSGFDAVTAPTLRHRSAIGGLRYSKPHGGKTSMGEDSTIGLDIAKSVFQGTWGRCCGRGSDPQTRQSRKSVGVLRRTAAIPC